MWELIETIVYYFKYKKWSLPIFLVLVLILLAFFWSVTIRKTGERLNETGVDTNTHAVATPVAIEVARNKETGGLEKFPLIKSSPPVLEPQLKVNLGASVSLFKDNLIDQLKVEGIDGETSEKILNHIRSQLGKNEPSDLSDSIRAILPDINERDVAYLTELVSQAATEAYEKGER